MKPAATRRPCAWGTTSVRGLRLRWVTFLFTQLMSEGLGEVCYGEQEKPIQGSGGGWRTWLHPPLVEDPRRLQGGPIRGRAIRQWWPGAKR